MAVIESLPLRQFYPVVNTLFIYVHSFRVSFLCRDDGTPPGVLYNRNSLVRRCKVSVADIEGVEHSTEVTAGSLYEAIAAALISLRKDDWVGEIGRGLTTVKVEVQQPPVTHEVRMKDFQAWLERKSGSPAEMVLRDKLVEMLAGSLSGPP
jgi:hypothetical protein